MKERKKMALRIFTKERLLPIENMKKIWAIYSMKFLPLSINNSTPKDINLGGRNNRLSPLSLGFRSEENRVGAYRERQAGACKQFR
jgi:hypothetical protein